ncbi:histone H3-K79 methyltransferase [Phytophthora cactorum]|nr:histone H3-K79 methyltransferase [Phytophthora cactorum]
MRTNFTDAQDRIIVLALEYESEHKRVEWKEVARAMRGKNSAQALENRLLSSVLTEGPIEVSTQFFSTSTPLPPHKRRLRLLVPSQAQCFARTSVNKLVRLIRTQMRYILLLYRV